MSVNKKIITRRLKSIANTKKITRAMELVSASKMRRAVNAVLGTRPYSTLAWRLVSQLQGAKVARAGESEAVHPLLADRKEIRKTLAILVSSDRGLCGGFNAQLSRITLELLRGRESKIDFIAIGKRGEAFLRRTRQNIVAAFGELIQTPSIIKVRPLARMAIDGFTQGEYDEVIVIYTDYVSAIVQKARLKTLLPIRRDSELGETGPAEGRKPQAASLKPQASTEYLFEPDPASVLDRLLPRIAETQLYQAVLESMASEHSARMLAMRNASDSATEMMDDLNFTYNQARQAGITQEIAEISAGTAALEKA